MFVKKERGKEGERDCLNYNHTPFWVHEQNWLRLKKSSPKEAKSHIKLLTDVLLPTPKLKPT